MAEAEMMGPAEAAEWQIATAALRHLHVCVGVEKDVQANIISKAYPDDKALQTEIIQEELTTDISQLEDLVSHLKDQNERLQKDIDREKQTQTEHKQLHTQLFQHLQLLQNKISTKHATTKDSVLNSLKNQHQQGREYLKEVVEKLEDFTDEHFPPPTKTNEEGKIPHSMSNLIVELVDKYLETPGDMYVDMDSQYLPPLVDTLVEYTIAERYPHDSNKIRIIPFFE